MLQQNQNRPDHGIHEDHEPGIVKSEIIEPEIIEPEIVETDDVEKEGQESRRPAGWKTEFQRWFGMPPFPLTAAKLKIIVLRIDRIGPIQLGAFYPVRLHEECALLLRHPIYGFDDRRFADLLTTWNQNFSYFKCRTIGEVLAYFAMARQNYETRRQNDVDHKK
ncbi:MAG: hypothetical protein IKO93_14105 [Lentisphaeria bacterium]|nr:hypothetical protein [Lentisphaeria bacterium]